MNLDKKNIIYNSAVTTGYLVACLIFTTIFYFILKLLNKLPNNWQWWHLLTMILFLNLIGGVIKKLNDQPSEKVS